MGELACRACRVLLSADNPGCAICSSIRPHLISIDEAIEDGVRPALSHVADETVAFLRERARWFRKELQTRPGAEHLDRGAVANANALTKLIEASRRLQADGLAAVQNMSFVERAKLFIEWYASLPPSYRVKLREQLVAHENDQALPVSVPRARLTSGVS